MWGINLDILSSISDFYFWVIFEKKLLYAYETAKLALKVCISRLIIIRIKKFSRFFLSKLYGMG
jgi:hypothetical protein